MPIHSTTETKYDDTCLYFQLSWRLSQEDEELKVIFSCMSLKQVCLKNKTKTKQENEWKHTIGDILA